MAHLVKCTVCGKQFDRDKVQAVKSGARRYAHYSCMPEGELVPMANPVDEELVALEDYIKNLLGDDYNPARVKKQIKDYKNEYDYTYSGMLKALMWFYEVKGESTDKANGGIGILPFIYNDARTYYYNLYLAQLINEEKDVNQYKTKVREIEICSPKPSPRYVKLFDLGED